MHFRVPLGYGLCVYILAALVRFFLGGKLLMKKTVSTILVACMMMLFMAPTLAEDDGFQPYGALVLDGGMKYVSSEGRLRTIWLKML